MKREVGLWIDYHKTVMVTMANEKEETREIRSNVKKHLLTHSAGFLQNNSTETTNFEGFEPSRYIAPSKNWLPPYPYCTDEVLFLVT